MRLPFQATIQDPSLQIIERELDRQVRTALLSLPPRYRAAIELRHFQELSYAEIAETLNLPLSDINPIYSVPENC